jgi:hypothetical protein
MAQRAEPHDSLDDFPTQPWATRALLKHVIAPAVPYDTSNLPICSTVWEPACNRGHMSKPLREWFDIVHTSDVHDYGTPEQERVADFLMNGSEPSGAIDWIITNPPFRLAEQFVERACGIARTGIAVIVRTAFLEGVGRYSNLFKRNPPSIVAQFTERVPIVKGRLTAKGSTATAYCWLVWIEGEPGTRMTWIPPCRKQLERAVDYEGCA